MLESKVACSVWILFIKLITHRLKL